MGKSKLNIKIVIIKKKFPNFMNFVMNFVKMKLIYYSFTYA